MRDRTLWGLTAAAAVLAILGPLFPPWVAFLMTVALGRGLVVLGLLILWRTGLVSFGQALYFAVGGYAVGLLGQYLGVHDAVLLVIAGVAGSVVVAAGLGLLIARYREIFFAMLTMAFSMILYGVLVKTEILGSTDGFAVVSPTFFGYAPGAGAAKLGVYWLVCATAYVAALGLHRYLSSPMGALAVAIRDNEIRVEYLGVSVKNAVHVKYVIAAALAGAGGAINALAVGHVDPEMAYWITSGEFVFVAVLSGTGSIAAPFAGSIVFELLRTYATQYAPYLWQLVVGSILLLLILFVPNGLWSLLSRRRWRRA
jgi:ABC-type branched-subunit amino acid transport system permease subunit